MIYLDSCALVKLIHVEPETDALQKYLDDHDEEVVTCDLALTEVPQVIRKANHDSQRRLLVTQAMLRKEIETAVDLLERISRIAIDERLFVAAGAYDTDPHLGSLDTLHLVAALELRPALTSFVTYDKALGRSVTQAGLSLIQPK